MELATQPVSRRTFLIGALAATGATLVAACSGIGGGPSAGGGGAQAPATSTAPANTIVFWHSMSGVNGDAVNRMIESFQQSQKQITVQGIFQGTYDDSLAKLKTALASNGAPALIQVYDIGQRFMIDSEEIVPMQNFIDRDKLALDDFEPAILNYYRVPDKLYSMPFNASSAILYYNKTAFKEAGLDPEKPPKTFDEITDFAKKLVKKSGADVSQYGFHQSIYGWLFEQYTGVSAGFYADNGNGRDSRATKVVFDNDKGRAIFDWWQAGVAGSYFSNQVATVGWRVGRPRVEARTQLASRRWQPDWWGESLPHEESSGRGAASRVGVCQVCHQSTHPGAMAVRHRLFRHPQVGGE